MVRGASSLQEKVPSGTHPPLVVLVDDDAAVLASLKFALEMEGLSVEAYQDPADLLMRAEPQNTN
jgi:FixJ family two-component response regulator